MIGVLLWLPEPPSANRYWRHVGSRVVLSREAKAYRETVTAVYAKYMGTLKVAFPKGDVQVSLDWYRSRKSGDLDNRIKQALDAFRGLAYTDDSQVASIEARRHDVPAYRGQLKVWVQSL